MTIKQLIDILKEYQDYYGDNLPIVDENGDEITLTANNFKTTIDSICNNKLIEEDITVGLSITQEV